MVEEEIRRREKLAPCGCLYTDETFTVEQRRQLFADPLWCDDSVHARRFLFDRPSQAIEIEEIGIALHPLSAARTSITCPQTVLAPPEYEGVSWQVFSCHPDDLVPSGKPPTKRGENSCTVGEEQPLNVGSVCDILVMHAFHESLVGLPFLPAALVASDMDNGRIKELAYPAQRGLNEAEALL